MKGHASKTVYQSIFTTPATKIMAARQAPVRASTLAGDTYVAFVADMYGDSAVTNGMVEAVELANALRADAPERLRRMNVALGVLSVESE